jgi:hypothetical protein
MTDVSIPPQPADPAARAVLDAVAAARSALGDEIVRLEATARAAVDVRAKVRRNTGKTAAAAAGTAFVVLGGPGKVFRSVKRRIVGAPEPLPASLLPEQVEKAVRRLGDDGAKVRGTLEREFAAFVDTNRKSEPRFLRRVLLAGGVPLASRVGRAIVKRLLTGSPDDVASREEQIRSRLEGPGPGAPTR